MADNTVLPTGGGGDTIRTLDRNLATSGTTGAKTEVIQLDIGGPESGVERLLSNTSPLPNTDPYTVLIAQMAVQQALIAQAAQIGGYVPLDTNLASMLGIQL